MYLEEILNPQLLGQKDLIIVPLVLVAVFIFFAWSFSKIRKRRTRVILYIAITCKFLFLAIRLVILFHVYDGKSDSTTYYRGSKYLYNLFWERPDLATEIVFNKVDRLSPEAREAVFRTRRSLIRVDHSPGIIVRTAAVLSLLCANSYIALCILFTSLAFYGSYLVFLAFWERYPFAERYIAMTLFIPSVLYWGGMVSKDSIMMFGLGILTYGVFSNRPSKTEKFFLLLVGSVILFKIKAYVLIVFVMSYLIFLALKSVRIRERPIKYVFSLVLLFMSILLIQLSLSQIKKVYGKANVETIVNRADRMIVGIDKGQSNYKVPGFSLTTPGIILGSGGAIITSFFRPFVWETKKLVYIPSVLEGLVSAAFMIWILFSTKLRTCFKILMAKDRMLLFSIIYSLLFAIIAGLFSFTFGSLVRYKIPAMIFLYLAIGIILAHSKYYHRKSVR